MRSRTIWVFAIAAASVYGQASSGQTAVANSNLQLVDAPPHGPLNLLVGKNVTSISKGEKLNIVNKKSYPSLSGNVIWYQVTQLNNPKAAPLWVYAGQDGKDSPIQIEKTVAPDPKAVMQAAPPETAAATKAPGAAKSPATQVAKHPAAKADKIAKQK